MSTVLVLNKMYQHYTTHLSSETSVGLDTLEQPLVKRHISLDIQG